MVKFFERRALVRAALAACALPADGNARAIAKQLSDLLDGHPVLVNPRGR